MKDIFSRRLYTRVARLGSFSAAARACGLSQSQVSPTIADLEGELGGPASDVSNAWWFARLLADWKTAVIPIHAYFPMGRATRAAGRAIVDDLVADFRREGVVAS